MAAGERGEESAAQRMQRISDITDEALRFIAHISGCEKMPLVSLEEAVEPLVSILPDVRRRVYISKENCENPADGLTQDESASIMLYTMEWESVDESLYRVLNKILRSEDRRRQLKPWHLFLRLFLNALFRLPLLSTTVYRGVLSDLSRQYREGETIVWWGFSDCTTSVGVLQSELCLGMTGHRTMFAIKCHSARDIHKHSTYPDENAVLLMAGTQFRVISYLNQGDLHIIQLEETIPPLPLVQPPPKPAPSPIISIPVDDGAPAEAFVQRDSYFKDVNMWPELIPFIRGCEKMPLVSLEEAVEPLVSILPDVRARVYLAKTRCENPADGLTQDESASIMLYTMEWEPADETLYYVLNTILRSEDRRRQLKRWHLFLRLFLNALFRLPLLSTTVYRGVRLDLSMQYREGETIVWWGFSDCTTSVGVLEPELYLGKTGHRTMFAIKCHSGRDIHRHSMYEAENEVLLMAGTQFRVIGCLNQGDLHIIQLEETIPPLPFVQPPPKPAPSPIKPMPIGLSSDTSKISPFYDACRENNISSVENYLKTMTVEEINRIEPNGSTALHVAAYRGHEKIVELLLQKGASYLTINKYNLTPLGEAKTDKIRQLIRRRMNKKRFVSDSVEWILQTNDADYQAHEYFKKLESYGKDPQFHKLIIYIRKNYLEKDLQDVDGINTIKEYFDKAINEKDPAYLLTAYTAETGFYTTLNVDLAKLHLENLTNEENLSRAYYIGIVARHPKFDTLSFTGEVFRGMMITAGDVTKYKIGTRILTKTFSSTSKQRHVASTFHEKKTDKDDRLSAICIYQIRNKRTAFDIQRLSLFAYEEEVLILPYSAFKIIDVIHNKEHSPQIEIKLRECEPWL
ncbi:unnamed protein product [Rotaria magnacalcarata]|uniref:NAD(P)(+)--arginine ADP-ribosyltransferase n=1 Tax=Rotaria magnacalcarata TaxID=392030 RepID=A0A819PWA9_9BILA|nr:unnamed protein product [Rotaria magnacalcarata]CAF2117706.1 unnamed protein product [Rotaria magnacalcarata]CAF3950309.1 unnamed protein product [Rotaria magnacalcarata]CAF4014627.1 unnamed protein product [Rotaria magnacalcarata]